MTYENLLMVCGDQALTILCEACGETFSPHHPLSFPVCDPCDDRIRAEFNASLREGPVFGDELADAYAEEVR